MAKKLKVVALVGVIHTITQLDLDANPHLVSEGLKVGEEVEIGNDVGQGEVIKKLEAENVKLKADKEISDGALINLSDDIEELSAEHENHRKTWQAELDDLKSNLSELDTTKNSRISDLEKELTEANDKIALTVEGGKRTGSSSNSILVNHAVIVGGKKFTKEQIEKDPNMQEVLLEMGSTAVTKIEG